MKFVEVATQPAAEPVSLTEAKAHLRVTSSDDDTYITSLISVARQTAETYLGRSIVTQTLRLTLPAFPDEIVLARPPVRSITSITYIDTAGNSQTLAGTEYQSNLRGSILHSIKPAYGKSWPATRPETYNAVTVNYVAGYSLPSSSPMLIPHPIRQAILLQVGEMYENREESIQGSISSDLYITAERLLAPYRVRQI